MVGLAAALAFAVSLLVAWLMVLVGPKVGFVDRPDDDLKIHTGEPVPLGGVALMVGLHGGLAMAGAFDPGLAVASGIVFVLGLIDDAMGLPPVVRLAITAVAGLALATMSDLVSGGLAILATILLSIVAVNAMNLFDGLDTLASGTAALGLTGLAIFAAVGGVASPWDPVVVSAALLGIIPFNWPPARLYLGDNGSYVVGIALTWAVLRAGADWQAGLIGIALIGIPLVDLVVTVLRRIRSGRPLFAGDRDHIYDRLHQRTGSILATSGLLALAQIVWAGILLLIAILAGTEAALIGAIAVGGVTFVAGWVTGRP